jgi:uncharacterized protein YfaS (alpha-2-macroglobulin family)
MSAHRRFTTTLLNVVLAAAILLSACNFFSPGATPVPPTPVPASPTPFPPIPPVVIDYLPQPGEELRDDGEITVYFDQPMDPATVEAAFAIEPRAAGAFAWSDENATLHFRPSGLERQRKYAVTVSNAAKNLNAQNLQVPFKFSFNTVGYLEVSQVLPAPGVQDAATSAAITVMFNRPVVPLTTLSQQADLPQPLALEPAVAGSGEWLTTSIYVFRPETALEAGRSYTGRIKAGLTDTTGGTLREDYSWSFTTLPPSVLFTNLGDGATGVALTQVISVTFNQPMDRAATEAAFSLTGADGQRVAGRFEWFYNPLRPDVAPEPQGSGGGRQAPSRPGGPDYSDTPPGSETLGFRPSARLQLDTEYTVRVAASARALGGTPLAAAYSSAFTTVPYPAIVRTTPEDGDRAVDPYSGFSIEFASPMDMSSIMEHITIIPEPTRVYTYGWYTSFTVTWDQQPSSDYEVRVAPGMRDEYGNEIGEALVVRFRTRAHDPAAYLNVPGNVGTYNGYNDTRVYARYRNVSRLDLALYHLSLEDFARITRSTGYESWNAYSPSSRNLVRAWSETPTAEQNATGYQELLLAGPGGGALEPGLYYLTISAPEVARADEFHNQPRRHALVVSPANLTIKAGWREGLVWATDLASGQPIANAPLRLYHADPETGAVRLLAEGRSDANGVWQAEYDRLDDLWNGLFATLEGGPAGFGLASTGWSLGIAPWDFNLPAQYDRGDYRGYVYTDRPIYRAGQTVYFKAILRADDDAQYALPDIRDVRAHIYDTEGREVYSTTLTMSPYGSAFGQFELAPNAGLGYYQVEVENEALGDEHFRPFFGVGFQVAAYRKPEFQVKVTADRPEVAQGDTIEVSAEASYFFGGPVSNAEVSYTVYANEHFLNYPGPGWYDFSDLDLSADRRFSFGYYNELIAEGRGRTDAQGRFTLDLPADLGDRVNSQDWSIEVAVTDITNQVVAERTIVVVHKGDFYVGLAPADYVGTIGQPQSIKLLTVDWAMRPVGQRTLDVVFMQHDWNCAMREDESGALQWQCDVIDTPVYTTTVTTNQGGQATATFTPDAGGVYRIQARGRDQAGRTVSASTYLWVASGEHVTWRQNNSDRIDLVAGQRRYQPGDTAEILIPAPFEGPVTALITVERGRILSTEVVTLESNSSVYRLPIRPEYTPNIFVSVVLMKPGSGEDEPADFRLGLINLEVANTQKAITLVLTPDQSEVGPRDTVTYEVRATDYSGRPVQAEVSVGLIDLAVLSLADPNAIPILDTFYGERGLGVRTGVGLSVSVDRLNLVAQENVESKGGGGGGGEAGDLTVRRDFPDTAFWQADLVTGPDGLAKFSVTLPDSLTTWRLDARGVSADTLVGQATVDIVATKPLLIRPVTPRFFVVGDRVQLAAIVNNNTGGTIQAEVTLSATGVDLADPATQEVTVPAGGQTRVTWGATVQDVPGVDLTFRVAGGGLEDASKPPLGQPPEQLLPVYKYATPETLGTAGELTGAESRTEVIALPPRLDVTQGEVQVKLSPSLAATTLDGLNALERFPYECLEQSVSRFVPNVATYRALKTLGINDAELEARLPQLISEGLQRLYAEQHSDGGWGWFVDNQSSPYLTAYALFGLAQAADAGFSVDAGVVDRASDFLRGELRAPKNVNGVHEANRQAWLLYVLAVAGEGDTARTVAWYEAREQLSHYARAYLALALAELDPADSARPQAIVGDLVSAAQLSATGAHWEERDADWQAMNTDTRSTAIILAALARIDPENALNANVVRWLLLARNGDGWSTTQETAWAILAFTDYMAATGELEAGYRWGVALNYQPLQTGEANGQTLRETTELTIDVASLLRDASNRLTIERSEGPGRLYYTTHLRAYLPVEDVPATSRGISVQREYFQALTPSEREQCERSGGKDPVCQREPISEAQVGDTIQVKLTLVVPSDLYYVYVEDPLPAGAEAIDTSLRTTRQSAEPPQLTPQDWDFWWGYWYFGHTQMRDEKTVLYAEVLPAGSYVYTYEMQATVAGEFKVMPTHAAEFYFPEVWGRSAGQVFRIVEP